MLFNHLILGHPLLLLPSIFPSIRVFSNESATLGGQSIRASVLASVLPMDIQGWFLLGFIGLILLSKGLSRVFPSNTIQKHQFFSAVYIQFSYPYMPTGKTIAWIIGMFVSKVMSLLFNMLSRFVIAFLPRSKSLLISWLQLLSTVFLEPKKRKSGTVSTFFLSICREVMGPNAMFFVFECWVLSQCLHVPVHPHKRRYSCSFCS